MKRTGIGLTFGGAALSVAGIVVMANSVYIDSYSSSDEEALQCSLGYLTTAIGVAAIAGGIILCSIGGSKVKKYIQKLDLFPLNLNLAPLQIISLAYRF